MATNKETNQGTAQITIGKGVKGFILGLIPIVLVTLKQHGCEVDDWRALGGDMIFALIPAVGHAAWYYFSKQ